MARSRTKPRRTIGKGRPQPAPQPEANLPQPAAPGDASVAILTTDILQHLRAANSQSVAVRAEVGRLLIELRAELPYGGFRLHLRDHLPFTPTTAERAMNLHRFRNKNPDLFDQLMPVGLSKANVLINLPVAEIGPLLATAHVVPSTNVEKTVVAMTFTEMMELIAHRAATPASVLLLRDYRRSTRRFMQSLDALIEEQPDDIDADDVAHLYEQLVHTLGRFAAAFELE